MSIPCFQVDAFTSEPFRGNPASICVLDAFLPDAQMQSIAAEHNLSETAFIVRRGDAYDLRWFTPACEVDLCGHATLASGWVVLNELEPRAAEARFDTRSGRLRVERRGGRYVLDLPVNHPRPAAAPPALHAALGLAGGVGGRETLAQREGWLVVLESERDVRGLRPNFRALADLQCETIIATAPSAMSGVDFVSRVFAPCAGIDEDPVTGSAHTVLAPYWAARLGKTTLRAHQASRRGGDLECTLAGDRVLLAGDAVLYSRGTIVAVTAPTPSPRPRTTAGSGSTPRA